MSQWDFSGQPAGPRREYDENTEYDEYGEFPQPDGHRPYNPYGQPGDYAPAGYSDDFEGGAFTPISYERDPYPPGQTAPLGPPLGPPPGPARRSAWPDESWPPRVQRPPRRPRRGRRPARARWLLPAAFVAVAAAAAGATMVLLGGHPADRAAGAAPSAPSVTTGPTAPSAPAAAPGPLTQAQARQVLAAYTSANNNANARMSDALLAGIETGSSYAIDAGIYRVQRAENAAPYPAFGPRQARFYIPSQPAGAYPHWFVVQAVNAGLSGARKVTGTEYLVFTQAAPGGPWRNTVEPYLVSGTAAPPVALGAGGLATPVAAGTTALAVSPAQVAGLTAASLDGGHGGPAMPGNLADRLDQWFWRQRLPSATVTDRHAPAGGQVFGLRTSDGGALVFYTDAAELTLTPPAGEAMHLTIPGFYSPGRPLTTAGVRYLEQFATYVPPRGGSGLRVVADYSGITAKN